MTKHQIRICKKIRRYKKLPLILQSCKIDGYIELQMKLPIGSVIFSDDNMDENTEVVLNSHIVEELEERHWDAIKTYVPWILSICAIIISIIALLSK